MKKLITFSIVCIIACIGFTSCTSKLAITKRHYNKGYYVDYSANKQIASVAKEKANRIKAPVPVSVLPVATESNTIPGNVAQITRAENTISINNAKSAKHKAVVASNTGGIATNLPIATEAPVMQVRAVSAVNSVTDNDHGHRDGLSLFWLIILIILIVWVLGLIAGGWGLGGLINILLIVALILLILWLLRIV